MGQQLIGDRGTRAGKTGNLAFLAQPGYACTFPAFWAQQRVQGLAWRLESVERTRDVPWSGGTSWEAATGKGTRWPGKGHRREGGARGWGLSPWAQEGGREEYPAAPVEAMAPPQQGEGSRGRGPRVCRGGRTWNRRKGEAGFSRKERAAHVPGSWVPSAFPPGPPSHFCPPPNLPGTPNSAQQEGRGVPFQEEAEPLWLLQRGWAPGGARSDRRWPPGWVGVRSGPAPCPAPRSLTWDQPPPPLLLFGFCAKP